MFRIFQQLLALLIVISMQTVYTKQVINNLEFFFIALSSVIVCIILFFNRNKIKLKKKTFVLMIFSNIPFFIVLGYRMITNLEATNVKANLMIVILFTVFFDLMILYFDNIQNSINYFFKDTSNVIAFLALISLFFFVFAQNSKFIAPTNQILIDWGGQRQITSWYGFHFNPQGSSYKQFIYGRNTGIFSEAPQFAFMLCYALIVELFLKEKFSFKKIIILMIAIYTTASTTGAIILIIAIGFKFYLYRPRSKGLQYLKKIVLPIGLITIVFLVIDIYIEKTNFGNSASIRNNNIQIAIYNFMQSPIIGMGFKADTIDIGGGNTSTITQVIQEGGLAFFTFYFSAFIPPIIFAFNKKNINILAYVLIYLLLLAPTVMTYTQFSVVMVAIMYTFSNYTFEN